MGAAAAAEIGSAIKAVGGKMISILPREVYARNNDRADLGLIGISLNVVKAIAITK